MRLLSVFTQPRLFIVMLMGFASGLPLALTGATLSAWYAKADVDIKTIGALSLVGLPYLWKFLWSPILDRFVPPWGGRRRGWIAITQIGLCISLFVLGNMNPTSQPIAMAMIALLIAFFSASQDIGIDAYRTELLHAEERGLGAAVYIFAYRIAMLVSGGLALILADQYGWRATYEIMAALLGLSLIVTFLAPEPKYMASAPKSFKEAVIDPFLDLLRREKIILILLFILVYKIGDALAFQLMSKFLINLGFSLTEMGVSYKTMGLIATILGAFVGGSLLISLNIYRALFVFGLAQAFSNLMFVFLSMAGKNMILMASSIFIENFCSGMSTAAFVAFFMMLCNPRYTATQFACLTAFAAVGRVLLGPVAAVIVSHYGWVNLYWCAFAISFPGLILLAFLQTRGRLNEALVQE